MTNNQNLDDYMREWNAENDQNNKNLNNARQHFFDSAISVAYQGVITILQMTNQIDSRTAKILRDGGKLLGSLGKMFGWW